MDNESISVLYPSNMEDMAVPCLLCGTFLNLNERESRRLILGYTPIKVCKECREAVAFAKKQMKNGG